VAIQTARNKGDHDRHHLDRELDVDAHGASDLSRLTTLMAEARLDGQIELEASWRDAPRALDALLERRIGGKAALRVD
jgi:NADPH:quinone reductase